MSRQHLHTILRHAETLAFDQAAVADADLLVQFVATRDDHAFAMLVRRHGAMVWNVCRNLLPSDADAEDAFQATFLALVRGGQRIRQGERIAAWLHGVAFRVAMKVRRTAAKRRQHENNAASTEASLPVSESSWNELLAAVHEEVERLPESLRSAFVLCCLEGVRQADAATQLGLKANTLTTRLARARQRVIENLTRRGIAVASASAAVGVGSATGTASVPLALTAQTIALVHSLETVSPTVLNLAQGAFEMSIRTRWLAAALLVAGAMTTTVGTIFFSDATGQAPADRNSSRPPTRSGGGTTQAAMFAARYTPPWEYKVATIGLNNSGAEADLNKLGEEGWELIVKGEGSTLVFKRQKPRTMPFPGGGATGGAEGGSGDGATGGAPATEKKAEGTTTKVFAMKHATASSISSTLTPLLSSDDPRDVRNFSNSLLGGSPRLSGRTKLTVDSRTNSLIVIADDATLKMIQELIEKLDVPVKDDATKPSK